jgi:hypothetical protein
MNQSRVFRQFKKYVAEAEESRKGAKDADLERIGKYRGRVIGPEGQLEISRGRKPPV